MGAGASSKAKYQETREPQVTPSLEKQSTLTLKQLAAGETSHIRCPDCGALIKPGCNAVYCPDCTQKKVAASGRRRSKSQIYLGDHREEDSKKSAEAPEDGKRHASRQSSKQSTEAPEDGVNSNRAHEDGNRHTSRQGSKQSTKGPEEYAGTRRNSFPIADSQTDPPSLVKACVAARQGESGGRRMSEPRLPQLQSSPAEAKEEKVVRRRKSVSDIGLQEPAPQPDASPNTGEKKVVRRRNSQASLTRKYSTVGAHDGESNMSDFKVGDRVCVDGKAGLEMGIGSVIGPASSMPGAVNIEFDSGAVWPIKCEHLLPPLTPALEVTYKRRSQIARRPSI